MRNLGNLDLTSEVAQNNNLGIQVEAGPHKAKIVRVADDFDRSKLTLWFDLGDQRFARACGNDFEKWSTKGKIDVWYNQMAMEQKTFDAFITAVKNSNQGFNWDWDEQKLVGKYIVVVYGEEEWQDKNDNYAVKVSIKPRMIRSVMALNNGDIKPLPLKKLKNKNNTQAPATNQYGNPNSFSVNPYTTPTIPTSSNDMYGDEPFPWEK